MKMKPTESIGKVFLDFSLLNGSGSLRKFSKIEIPFPYAVQRNKNNERITKVK